MITDLLLGICYTIVNGAWALIPAWDITLPDIQPMVSEFSKWNYFVPFSEFTAIMAIVATFFVAVVGFKVVKQVIDWIMDVIP